LQLFSFGSYGLALAASALAASALAASALVVFGAIECPPSPRVSAFYFED